MSAEKDALQRMILAHKGTDRGLELATSLGLDVGDYASAKLLHIAILKSNRWTNQRSPHGLMVDCLYLSANRNGVKISARDMTQLTLKIFDVGTQPIPSRWKKDFLDLIEEYL
tara:strand:+ start:1047 stop:1385 length:339 start_codon:yes stop_codon:yes gene_type:complete